MRRLQVVVQDAAAGQGEVAAPVEALEEGAGRQPVERAVALGLISAVQGPS